MASFWETMLLITLKRQNLVQCFLNVQNIVWTRFRIQIRNRKRNRNKSLRFQNTDLQEFFDNLLPEKLDKCEKKKKFGRGGRLVYYYVYYCEYSWDTLM
jgi:hypothetical protein